MQGMILGDVPEFEWVIDQLQRAQDTINCTRPVIYARATISNSSS